MIGVLTTIIGYALTPATVNPYYPCLMYAMIGVIIGTIFMHLFVKCSDSIIVIYLIDHEIHLSHYGKDGAANQKVR